jgi:hypothetical protein
MNLPHPIRRIRATIKSVQETLLIFAIALESHRQTIEANTTANAEILSTLKSLLLEAATTEKAVSYLANVERHRQIAAGQPHVFNEVSQ